MNIILRHLTVVTLLGFFACGLHAQEARIGFIYTEKLMRDSSAAKQAEAKLQQEFSKREKDLNDAALSLKSAIEKFERDAPTLPETPRASKQKQLGEQERDLIRKRREFQEELNARKNEEMQQVVDRINRAIRQLGEAEKYDLIVENALYINPKHDITDKVLKAINSGK
jgi:outer membrane protein